MALTPVAIKARLIVIGDRRVFDAGTAIAGVNASLKTVGPDTNLTVHHDERLLSTLVLSMQHLASEAWLRNREANSPLKIIVERSHSRAPRRRRGVLHALQQEGDAAGARRL